MNLESFAQLGFSFAVTGYLLIRMEATIRGLTAAVNRLSRSVETCPKKEKK